MISLTLTLKTLLRFRGPGKTWIHGLTSGSRAKTGLFPATFRAFVESGRSPRAHLRMRTRFRRGPKV
jgi:hypothetical protein